MSPAWWCATATAVRMFANTCRHRGHELLPDGATSDRRKVVCPYHAWTYDLAGQLIGAPGFREDEPASTSPSTASRSCRCEVWEGWVFGHALHPLGVPKCRRSRSTSVSFGTVLAPYAPGQLGVGDRHTYEVAANWKVISENYHECYHCPLIHPELCQVSPPTSGDNYDLPGGWVGGSMELRDGMRTMSLTGELAATPIPDAPPTAVEYLHLLPNLLVSAHPDYVMTHRMVPLAPTGPGWSARGWCCPVPTARPRRRRARGVLGPHQQAGLGGVRVGAARPRQPALPPGPFAPNEDAVSRLVSMIGRAYVTGHLPLVEQRAPASVVETP